MPRKPATAKLNSQDPIREATIRALKCVVDPLVDLMFDGGITVHELCALIRERSVRTAAVRLTKDGGHESKARLAIITGLPRSAVSEILSTAESSGKDSHGQHPARKILAAWYEDSRFLTALGDPAVLTIFGKRRSFEYLMAIYAAGIPVRAMLDELIQIDAVEVISSQRLRAKSRVPIFTGVNSSAIGAIGERTRDLLGTLKHNLRPSSKPLFEGTVLFEDVDPEAVPLIRREIEEQGATFIQSANSLFSRARIKPSRSTSKLPRKRRVGMTVYYFQDPDEIEGNARAPAVIGRRKNLQRKRPRIVLL